jgi:hypothetical protein
MQCSAKRPHRFNALKHGLLSRYTVRVLVVVLPQVSVWDNAALLCALLLLPERARIRSTVTRGQ